MSLDGARVDFGFLSLADLIVQAYKIKPYQLTGPDWMKQDRFDVLAKLPDGASKDQVPEMLQALLAERFKVAIHRDTTARLPAGGGKERTKDEGIGAQYGCSGRGFRRQRACARWRQGQLRRGDSRWPGEHKEEGAR